MNDPQASYPYQLCDNSCTAYANEAITCSMHVTRPTGSSTVNLGSNSIHKQAYFRSQAQTSISQPGVLLFRDLARLTTQPDSRRGCQCVADYTSDRIKFHIENEPDNIVALFYPTRPMNDIGQGISSVVWEDIRSDMEDESW
ncbi:hypothetical protein AX14_007895 [Amanita brunnescens Koide BX004]|nr:hypothetical protein AX14_007895 [Amanita brunnescens Koide BX004]